MSLINKLTNPATIFAATVIVLAGGFYGLFDLYLKSVSKEIAMSWIQSEAVAIQEGNLLSSIAKNQRVLLSSQFVKGIKLVDRSVAAKRPLIELGEAFETSSFNDLKSRDLVSAVAGFLHRVAVFQIPGQPDLIIYFDVRSDFLIRTYLATVATFVLLFILLVACIRLLETKRIEAENRNQILLGEVAARVAHDIRSPLNTLNAVLDSLHDLSPNSRDLLRTAIQRIREIGIGIADQSRLAALELPLGNQIGTEKLTRNQSMLLFPVLEELVDEKRLQHPSRSQDFWLKVSPGCESVFADVSTLELRRSLSNLLDNAIEASAEGTEIAISLDSVGESLRIGISDRGVGIPKDALRRLGEKGFSRGKSFGTGLGVHYAKKAIESWSGRLEFSSEVERGTKAEIILPLASKPEWLVDSIDLGGRTSIVIIDDDPTVHAVWKKRLGNGIGEFEFEHFYDFRSASSWLVQNRGSLHSRLLLVDFNLDSTDQNGITLLERFDLGSPTALLVTDAFNDRLVRERAVQNKIRIMPKTLIDHVAVNT
jgi:signal transduction histidine kinase